MGREFEILVIDDEPLVGKRLRSVLRKLAGRVEICSDPQQALALLEKQRFDVVITDIVMGEVDGLQVLERAQTCCPGCKVIMITGFAMLSVAQRALESGAFAFVAKPFSPDDLREVVSRALAELRAAAGPDDQETSE